MPLIDVRNLNKTYLVAKKDGGVRGALRGLLRPVKHEVDAVRDISFTIEPGEIVGFIGPNGAGKSTTIKMLAGILHPTSGSIEIDGRSPQKDRRRVVRSIGVVLGQRTQLYWDLRLGESFELLKRIYQVDAAGFAEAMDLMVDVLRIDELLDVPVRQLSLGQRMRGELAAAMLHSPRILFLDEPTIGMDIEVKRSIRRFILEVNRLRKTTILLTTHDLNDIEELCQRLIVINRGRIIEDDTLENLRNKITPYRYLYVESDEVIQESYLPDIEIVDRADDWICIRFDKNRVTTSRLISLLSERYPIKDISLKEPDMEDVLRGIYVE